MQNQEWYHNKGSKKKPENTTKLPLVLNGSVVTNWTNNIKHISCLNASGITAIYNITTLISSWAGSEIK